MFLEGKGGKNMKGVAETNEKEKERRGLPEVSYQVSR